MNATRTIPQLESEIVSRGYSISKKYDGIKGICTVTATRRLTDSVIVDANRSSMPLWNAYKRALEFVYQQMLEYEKAVGKGF